MPTSEYNKKYSASTETDISKNTENLTTNYVIDHVTDIGDVIGQGHDVVNHVTS